MMHFMYQLCAKSLYTCALVCLLSLALQAQEETTVSDAATAAVTDSTAADSSTAISEVISAEVDWFKELYRGGNTSIALIVLFFAMIGFAVERLVRLRRSAIIAPNLVPDVKPLWAQGQFNEISRICEERPSVLSTMVNYLCHHRATDPDLLIQGAGDIGARELKAHKDRAFSLAVVAGLAPLLGLLGTMIGMIESFKLVEQYGDEGGASMLAGSISKALITTAVGLIIAIPALSLYHFFKFRCNVLGHELDEEIEILVNAWLLKQATEESNDAQAAETDAEASAADAKAVVA